MAVPQKHGIQYMYMSCGFNGNLVVQCIAHLLCLSHRITTLLLGRYLIKDVVHMYMRFNRNMPFQPLVLRSQPYIKVEQ